MSEGEQIPVTILVEINDRLTQQLLEEKEKATRANDSMVSAEIEDMRRARYQVETSGVKSWSRWQKRLRKPENPQSLM